MKTALAAVKGIAEQTQGSVESINNSVGKKENQVDEAIKSNDDWSPHRLHPQYGVEYIDRLKVCPMAI